MISSKRPRREACESASQGQTWHETTIASHSSQPCRSSSKISPQDNVAFICLHWPEPRVLDRALDDSESMLISPSRSISREKYMQRKVYAEYISFSKYMQRKVPRPIKIFISSKEKIQSIYVYL